MCPLVLFNNPLTCYPSLHTQDGHVDVARLLLDHGAQVNMPADSFESPLTLSACGGHHELAALLISRGADLEEVNDEGLVCVCYILYVILGFVCVCLSCVDLQACVCCVRDV